MEGLKDIKDIVEVPDHSLWVLLGVIAFALLLLGVLGYLFKNRRKRRKKPTQKELAKAKLKALEFSNTKEVVYTFEEKATHFLDENRRAEYEAIVKEFTPYKYKREIPPLDGALQKRIEKFIKEIK